MSENYVKTEKNENYETFENLLARLNVILSNLEREVFPIETLSEKLEESFHIFNQLNQTLQNSHARVTEVLSLRKLTQLQPGEG